MDISTEVDELCLNYYHSITQLMQAILKEENQVLNQAAKKLAEQIQADRLIHVFGPGGHSNLATQEAFFRAGGLMHISAILDEGTLLSNGALRSMAIERTPGYGKVVIRNQNLGSSDILILVNAYGINSALIDAALTAKSMGVYLIGLSSHKHATQTAADHPARHPSKKNLHELVDLAVDTKVPIGDAMVNIPGVEERVASISTYANAFTLNCLVVKTVATLAAAGVNPPIWRSGNAPGGDEANSRFIEQFRHRIKAL